MHDSINSLQKEMESELLKIESSFMNERNLEIIKKIRKNLIYN